MSDSLLTALPIAGVRLGAACAGIRYTDRLDLAVIELAAGGTGAAVFTRNAFCAAPVQVAKAHLHAAMPRYLVINSGNANAGTGKQGVADARTVCAAVAELTGCTAEQVLPFSTGVIGEALPLGRLQAALPQALQTLSEDGWRPAARAIMTTDTQPKIAARAVSCDGHSLAVTGIAKGAGMICPDMATMLAFVATDAGVAPALLHACLTQAVAASFNAITIDGDTSTNDACVLLASGHSGLQIATAADPVYQALVQAVTEVCIELAQAIVRDGEGATKFVSVMVEQGRDVAECRQVAYAIAHSPLVKTALFASDPNWGRILAAVGRAGLDDLAVDQVAIYLNDVCIVFGGERAADYHEGQGQRALAASDIEIRVQLGRGVAAARIWTTDLSYDYVRINADYRT